ncbi:hypothetical protein GWO43_02420 [candidate division KSB1 bacterium]|nr:hypothetical protein [candidate division KSB1 bacterium]NIR69720.1 hypothetical protein [candidate division KSB1 bacterium]NIS22908.1 hypothetical protein [candidate division KSB1 bacterium]NIT69765.1 hypothetical protein [candidate division KSB1 bacterium]NIU23439.1 hypothetical protein [candidate division KSB1 bacterium]
MNRIFQILLLNFALTLCACDMPSILDDGSQQESRSQEAPILLSVEITGGIAGVNQQLRVDIQGKAVFNDQSIQRKSWTNQLSDSELDSLVNLFLINDYFQLEDRYFDPQVADAFHYAISFTHDEKTKVVQTDNFGAPENLKRIVEGIHALIDEVRNTGLELRLELSGDELLLGDTVDLTLFVTNSRTTPVTLHFSSGQSFDFYARVASADRGAIVWNWAHDKAFIQVLRNVDLEAAETRSYQVTWDGRDNRGRFITGEVFAGAELVSVPGGSPAEKRLTIKSAEDE